MHSSLQRPALALEGHKTHLEGKGGLVWITAFVWRPPQGASFSDAVFILTD